MAGEAAAMAAPEETGVDQYTRRRRSTHVGPKGCFIDTQVESPIRTERAARLVEIWARSIKRKFFPSFSINLNFSKHFSCYRFGVFILNPN
jgi:hypothetical protein